MIGSPLNGGFKTSNEPAKTQNGLILCCLPHDVKWLACPTPYSNNGSELRPEGVSKLHGPKRKPAIYTPSAPLGRYVIRTSCFTIALIIPGIKKIGYINKNKLGIHHEISKSARRNQNAIACKPEQNVSTREINAKDLQL